MIYYFYSIQKYKRKRAYMRNVIPMNMQNYTLSWKIFIITNYPFYTKHISSIPCDINRDMATFLFSYVSRARSNKHWF